LPAYPFFVLISDDAKKFDNIRTRKELNRGKGGAKNAKVKPGKGNKSLPSNAKMVFI